MKRLLIPFLALALCPPVQAGPFQPFAALSRGSDCKIVLNFPDGEFCGETVPVDSVRSWYFGDGSTVGNETEMLMGQKYDFGIVVNADAGPKVISIRFLNPGTAKRFHVQMGARTGKPSATGTDSPFPNWLKLAR